MIAGAAIAIIGLFLMFFQVFRGIQTPIGDIGYYEYSEYATFGFYLLIGGIVILVVSAAIPSSKPQVSEYSPLSPSTLTSTQIKREPFKQIIKVKCPKCGHLNDEEARFCSECGTQF